MHLNAILMYLALNIISYSFKYYSLRITNSMDYTVLVHHITL